MSENTIKVRTMFLVTVNLDGTVNTWSQMPEADLDPERHATIQDIYVASKDLVNEVEAQLMAERVGAVIARSLTPQPTDTASRMREALGKRTADEGAEEGAEEQVDE